MARAGASGWTARIPATLLAIAAIACVCAPEAQAGPKCGGVPFRPTIIGTPGPDTLRGTNGFDVIRAGGGDDKVEGRGGSDYICGGPGDDLIYGGDNGDTLKGGSDDDIMVGGEGGDSIFGQGGTDSADGAEDLDSCLAEDLAGCESDIAVSRGPFPFSVTAGDSRVYNWTRSVQVGGSTAQSVYVIIDLPSEAEYVPGNAACFESPVDRINCSLGTIEAYHTTTIGYSFRLPDCPQPGAPALRFGAYAADEFNADPFPDNNAMTEQVSVSRAPTCPQ